MTLHMKTNANIEKSSNLKTTSDIKLNSNKEKTHNMTLTVSQIEEMIRKNFPP